MAVLTPRRSGRVPRAAAALLVGVAASGALPGNALHGQLSQEEALALAFPGADEIQRHTAFLDPEQLDQARDMAGPGVDVDSGIVTYYLAVQDGVPAGVAYFDAHRVRTLPEVLMVVVSPEGTVTRVETVSFREPPEYQAPEGWLDLMEGRSLGEDLSLKGDIPNLTGATLTAQAAVAATRRVLALHTVIAPMARFGPGAPDGDRR
jgi:hypothetical protein